MSVSHALIYLCNSDFRTTVNFDSIGLNKQNKLISVSKSVVYKQPPDLKKPYLNDIKAIEIEQRQPSLFITVSTARMAKNTVALSDGENFTIDINPAACTCFGGYDLIELEILAMKKKFDKYAEMVDESLLAFPTSVQVFVDKDFVRYFRDQSSCSVELVHKREHFGYVARLKYAERADMRQIRTDDHLIRVKDLPAFSIQKADIVTFDQLFSLEQGL